MNNLRFRRFRRTLTKIRNIYGIGIGVFIPMWCVLSLSLPSKEVIAINEQQERLQQSVSNTIVDTQEKVALVELLPPKKLNDLIPILDSIYHPKNKDGRKVFNDFKYLEFWKPSAWSFDELYGIPWSVIVTVPRLETHGYTEGTGRKGGGAGIKAYPELWRTVTFKGQRYVYNERGIKAVGVNRGHDMKEVWSTAVAYNKYDATWHSISDFCRFLRGIYWNGELDKNGNPILKDRESMYEGRVKRWMAKGCSYEQSWINAMAADVFPSKKQRAYHTSGCLCVGDMISKCRQIRLESAKKRYDWLLKNALEGDESCLTYEYREVKLGSL